MYCKILNSEVIGIIRCRKNCKGCPIFENMKIIKNIEEKIKKVE